MKYRNIRNGRIIEISSRLTSPEWVEVSDISVKTDKAVKNIERGKKEVRRSK